MEITFLLRTQKCKDKRTETEKRMLGAAARRRTMRGGVRRAQGG
jgi:hypothetical protein